MSQTLRSSRIIGTGRYLPEKILTNADLESIVDTSDEWITTRTGIKSRHVAREDEACSDLAIHAARQALEMADVKPEDLDAVIMGTISGDMQFPATAVFVQDAIGASNAVALDLSAACSGFIYATNMAHALIASNQMNRVLVIGAEVLTKFLDWEDRSTCVLFGDGAGAAVLEPCDHGEGILSTYMKSDGALADLLCIPGGGSRSPVTDTTHAERMQYIKMKGDGVFKWAVRAMAGATRQVVEDSGHTLDDVSLFVPHQANLRIIDSVVDRLGMAEDKVVSNLDRYGNTSSATIPIAFDEAVRAGRTKPGDLIVLTSFGGGFTWGSLIFKNTLG